LIKGNGISYGGRGLINRRGFFSGEMGLLQDEKDCFRRKLGVLRRKEDGFLGR
jgi:hypothetical protein